MILMDMGVPVHLIGLLSMLYTDQEATRSTEFGETYNIDISKGVRQGCIISPLLFNVYAENIMREALDECESGISVGGRMVTNLRYAGDTTLFVGTKEDLTELVERGSRASEKAELYLNVGKAKAISTGDTNRGGSSNENRFLGRADYQGWTMREESAKNNSYGKNRNERTNTDMEG